MPTASRLPRAEDASERFLIRTREDREPEVFLTSEAAAIRLGHLLFQLRPEGAAEPLADSLNDARQLLGKLERYEVDAVAIGDISLSVVPAEKLAETLRPVRQAA